MPYGACYVQCTEYPIYGITLLSRASTHGRLHLKPENLGVGPYTEEVLE